MLASKGRILLVDDEPLVLEIIACALREEGYEVCCAPDSQTALKFLEKTFFEGLVCDVRLEHLDGFAILQIARNSNPNLTSILISGAKTGRDEQMARALGAEYLLKPLSLGELIVKLGAGIDHLGESVNF